MVGIKGTVKIRKRWKKVFRYTNFLLLKSHRNFFSFYFYKIKT